jgi:hypothetical protein
MHLGSAHSRARPALPSGPAPLGVLAQLRKQGRGNPLRRRQLTDQIRPASHRWSAGKRPGSKPGRWWSWFGAKGSGSLTMAGSRRRWRSGRGGRRWGGQPAVAGSVGEVGEHLKARATLLAGSTGPEEHQRWRSMVAGETSSGSGVPRRELEQSPSRGGESRV